MCNYIILAIIYYIHAYRNVLILIILFILHDYFVSTVRFSVINGVENSIYALGNQFKPILNSLIPQCEC